MAEEARRSRVVSIIGGARVDAETLDHAEACGRLLAERGFVVATGGLGGVMEAASRGAARAGGTVLGILPGRDRAAANRYVTIALPTGLGEARNTLVATAGVGAIAIGGEVGTLSEIAFALHRGLPVVTLGSWQLDRERLLTGRAFICADTAAAAVEALIAAVDTTC